MVNGDDSSNHSVYSNRKRKSTQSPHRTKRLQIVQTDAHSYVLNEATNSKDNTTVNVSFSKFKKFDSNEYEDSEPTFIEPIESESHNSAEDNNDCVITNEVKTTIIDLSCDEAAEGSSQMIELILCSDVEPESEMVNEYVIEISNDLEDQELSEPLNVNFTAFSESVDDACQSIDLTDVTDERCNERGKRAVCGSDKVLTIDLTSEQTSDVQTNVDDSVSESTTAVIDQIRRKLDCRYPDAVQSISWNDKTTQFEISISKKNGFKSNDVFQKYLRQVVNDAIQFKHRSEIASKKTASEKIILNKDYALKQQRADSSSSTGSDRAPLPTKTQIVSNYNANQILKKSESYLGVTVDTFERIENLLEGRFKNRSILILLLRKLKLNEPFSILSDVLCPNKDDCINIYKEFLAEVSRTLHVFIRWPTNSSESLAIVDIFEIEIEKPNSFVEQSVSFCSQRQRYIVKFLICCTSTGYICHVSIPFYSIQEKILLSCFASIPKYSSVVVNPNLLNFGKKIPRIASLFDYDHHAERNVMRRVFDRLRRFGLITSVSDRKNVNKLQQTVSVVASLCNLEGKIKC